ncbi:MAG: family 78 glycoside hydrolase catalytic domain [Verrucomicrobiota bacterium]
MNPPSETHLHSRPTKCSPLRLCALALLTLGQITLGAVKIDHLRCEYLTQPLGIDEVKPRLSWRLDSLERGQAQTAWRILVASTPEALAADQGDLWDSGKVLGDATSQIEYAGVALSSRSECHWKVRSWDAQDQPSAWSAPAKWTVGLLESADWSAKWIDGSAFATASSSGSPPTILLASYEGVAAGSGALDVTAQVTSMIADGNFALSVTNGSFGSDPAFGTVKALRIQYQRGGTTLTRSFPEKSVVMLPADLTAPMIVSARYESVSNPETRFRDVTSTLTSLATSSFSIGVNNTTFDPDPAPNQVKRLKIEYTVDGVAGVITKAENTTFHFPDDLPRPIVATITAAQYEAVDGSASNDVLATLTAMASNGSYSITANNANFGPDPAYLKVKRLRLEFQRDGRSWVKFIAENKVFNYPADLASASAVPVLRKPFTVTKSVRKATMVVTALGLYELHLNGSRVGDHVLAPEWTDYSKRLNYQVYDVTSQLVSGQNVIGAQLANGWYSGHIGNGGYQFWGVSPALLAQLEITYDDGSSERIVSDGSWKISTSPTLATDFMLGEDYDARREINSWSAPGFDDTTWSQVVLRAEPPRPMSGQTMEPVRKLMEIAPIGITQPVAGKWVYDIGQNMVGFVRLKITAPSGTKITLRHAEMLNPDGTLYTDNLRGAPSVDTYVCKGGGEEIWQPKFTFHGFRYVELSGVSAQPPLDTITGIVIGSDIPRSGDFTCSDGMVNQLQSNIEWGQRGNYLSVPTDCPQRDERLGWLGDAQVFVKTATYNSDIAAFFTKWSRDVTDSQLANGTFPDVAPNAAPSSGTPAWSDAGVICPWTIYQAYGDKRVLANCYDSMKAWVEYCRANSTNSIRDRGRGADYGDWLSIAADTNKELIGTAYYAYSTHLLSQAAAVLGHTADATAYATLFQTIKAAFISKYVNTSTGAFIGTGSNTQCAYVMALKFDLLPQNLRAAVVQRLEDDVIAKGNHLSTGFVGVGYLLPTLTEGGKNQTAYNLLRQDTFPSWLFSVKNGATTIWERWDGWTPENGFQTPIMNSFNHYSLGSCGEWLYGSVAGISQDPSSVGYKKIIIRPQPNSEIDSAQASLITMHGRVSSSWRNYAGGFTLDTTIPTNTTAVIHVPTTDVMQVMESGMPATGVNGITFLGIQNGAARFEVGSGRYQFTVGSAIAPGADEAWHDAGAPVKMRISTLLANDGAGPFEFVSAGPLSVDGATITMEDGYVFYTPLAGSSGTDSFTYTIRDAAGGISTRSVQVNVIPADAPVQKTLSFESLPDGSRRVLFSGEPGRIYRIESSETLNGPLSWTTRATIQADEDGTFELVDVPTLPPARFYRAVFP